MPEKTCRFCKSALIQSFCNLGKSPLSNSYLKEQDLKKEEPFFPLHAYVCDNCFLVQLEEFQSPFDIFNDYAYFSSYSESWLAHCKEYVETILDRFKLDHSHQVIEIASNDGYLLKYFKDKKIPALGIEPAANVAKVAIGKGIPTLVKFFGVKTALELKNEGIQADLLLGNNVLAHVPDLNDFVEGMKIALKPTGVITMEFPHLLKLMEQNQFDTIYHEHFSYFSFLTVEKVFAKHNLTLFDCEEIPTHGGSLRIYVKHQEDNSKPIQNRILALREKEISFGLNNMDTYLQFQKKVDQTKLSLINFLQEAKAANKTVVGYGAPAKGNTLLNACQITKELISYTVDKSPYKQGHYLPGTHIPIKDPNCIFETKPDYLLILPWNLKTEIMDQMQEIRSWGGKFAIPIPYVEVL